MAIDILSARTQIEQMVAGLSSGTGVSFGDKSIIIYVSDYTKEQEIRNRIGNNYQGFPLKFVVSGNVTMFQ